MERKETGLLFLYNALFAISSKYKELEHLESPIFEVMDEIDSCINTGFNDQAFKNYSDSGINNDIIFDLRSFKDFVTKIDSHYWNPHDFDHFEDWIIARKWAGKLLGKLGMIKNGWNNGSSKVIYLK